MAVIKQAIGGQGPHLAALRGLDARITWTISEGSEDDDERAGMAACSGCHNESGNPCQIHG